MGRWGIAPPAGTFWVPLCSPFSFSLCSSTTGLTRWALVQPGGQGERERGPRLWVSTPSCPLLQSGGHSCLRGPPSAPLTLSSLDGRVSCCGDTLMLFLLPPEVRIQFLKSPRPARHWHHLLPAKPTISSQEDPLCEAFPRDDPRFARLLLRTACPFPRTLSGFGVVPL